jgi:hypothetical protein
MHAHASDRNPPCQINSNHFRTPVMRTQSPSWIQQQRRKRVSRPGFGVVSRMLLRLGGAKRKRADRGARGQTCASTLAPPKCGAYAATTSAACGARVHFALRRKGERNPLFRLQHLSSGCHAGSADHAPSVLPPLAPATRGARSRRATPASRGPPRGRAPRRGVRGPRSPARGARGALRGEGRGVSD